jgi:hypothetical protein
MTGTAFIESMEPRVLFAVTPTFAADANFYTGQAPVAVATGDFNRDGNLDFVTADSTGGTITIRRGRGDGTFRPATTIAVGSNPIDVVAADFNKDGKLDLAVALAGESSIVSYLGDGAGGFTFKGRVGTGKLADNFEFSAVKLVTGDFDKDGKLDLAITNSGEDTISVLRGKGTGAFYFRITSVVPRLSSFPNSRLFLEGLAAADFNGDGKTDLAVSGFQAVDVLLSNGDGHFTLKSQFGNGDVELSDARDIAIADVDGDTILDLTVVNGGLDRVLILRGTGGGSFVDGGNYSVDVWPVGFDRGPSAIATGDFNKDGKIDLVTANSDFAGTRTVLVNDGSGHFTQAIESPFLDDSSDPPVESPYHPVDIATGDFAKDGKIDVLVVNQNLNNVTLMKNTTT